MRIWRRCARYLALSALLAGALLAHSPFAFGLDPNLDVSQYAHNAWKIREGFTKGEIFAITQTSDGYLWLGTDSGLLRFDGVIADPWKPPSGQHLPSNSIWRLLGARDGTLWIGTDKGLASWRSGQLTQYPELSGMYIFSLLEDRDGTVWASGYGIPTGKLCAIANGDVHCYGQDGSLGPGPFGQYEDSKGNLWLGVMNGLWRWKPGISNFYSLPDSVDSIHAFVEDEDGALVLTTRGGLKRLVDGKFEPYQLPGNVSSSRVARMLRDRDGGLWLATSDRGIVHTHHGRTDVFAQSNGLSGNGVLAFFEDHEGSVWVITANGLDRFRELAVASISVNQGSSGAVWSVLGAADGTIWISNPGGLEQWKDGKITTFGKRTGDPKRDHDDRSGNLNGDLPNSLFQDSRGRIWVSTLHGFGYLVKDRFVPVRGVPGGPVHSITEDKAGNLWIANQNSGLFELSANNEIRQIPWAALGQNGFAYSIIADRSRGGLWMGFFRGGVAYFSDGAIRESYGSADGLGEGMVHTLRFDPDGTLWVASQGGLSRLKNHRFATLNGKDGLPCDGVHWMMEDDDHRVWLHMACGLVRVAQSEIDAWAAEIDANKRQDTRPTLHLLVFDNSDGAATRSIPSGFRPLVAKSADGKLWFTGNDGASVLDPRHLPFNRLPPPVYIEQISADNKTYAAASDAKDSVRLPPLTRNLQIDYTALSFAAPEKVLFRYKLEGWDRDWQDGGTRRQAFYANLPPREYTFLVKACNNSGVWNEAGAALNFLVAPAYYQTWWFRAACIAACLTLAGAFYRMRLRQLKTQFNIGLEARISERTRIARDLHDTMLQSFQGVLLKFHALSFMMDRPKEARAMLESLVDQASRAISEGREAVQGLRSSGVIGKDIPQALTILGEDLASQNGEPRPDFRVHVEGTPQNLSPLLRDEIYQIACEGVRNAFRHAEARRIEVEIRYDQRQLRLRIRDNGKGIDPKVLGEGGRIGHYGLPGMHERARLLGGKLTLWSEIDSGTEAELTVPAAVAYARSTNGRYSFFWQKGA